MRTEGSAAVLAREAALLAEASAMTPVMKILPPVLIMTCFPSCHPAD
jgi:hypothetical protein